MTSAGGRLSGEKLLDSRAETSVADSGSDHPIKSSTWPKKELDAEPLPGLAPMSGGTTRLSTEFDVSMCSVASGHVSLRYPDT